MKGIKVKSEIAKLLDDSLESNYWLGFILADGHVSKNGRLRILINNKDRELLVNFCIYIKCPLTSIKETVRGNNTYCYVSFMDKSVISSLYVKYDISHKKTYNPPVKRRILSSELICLYIGFIDGDGSIRNLHNRKDVNIAIKCHSSWKDFLTYMQEDLYSYFNCEKHGENREALINRRGYAYVTFSNNLLLKKIRTFIEDNKLPVLARKWDIIDLTYVSKYETSCINYKRIVELLNQGMSIVNISRELNIKYSTVYQSLLRKGGLP